MARASMLRTLSVLIAAGTMLGASASPAWAAPAISGFSPTSGPVGTKVIITGSGFTGASAVRFHGTPDPTFAVNSDTQITAHVPTGAATGPIAVTVAGVTAKSATKFVVAPAVTLSKAVGPPTTALAVSGTNLGAFEAVDVFFDTTDEALASTNGSGAFSGITITVPTSATPGTHWVTAVGRHSGLSAQASFRVRTDWPQFRFSPKHRGRNPFENVLSPSTVSGLDQDWTGATGKSIFSSPAVANGVVYVGSQDDKLYAFRASGCGASACSPLWTGATGGFIFSSPAVAKGVVYVGSFDHKLYAFSASGCGASACSPLWTGATGGGIVGSSPAVAKGVVYVGSRRDDKLYAFSASGCGAPVCSPLWTGATGSAIISSPAVANGVVYVGSLDEKLYAFNASGCGASACSPLWTGATGNVIYSSPAVANGVVYVGSADDKLYAWDLAAGIEAPTRPNPARLRPNYRLAAQS